MTITAEQLQAEEIIRKNAERKAKLRAYRRREKADPLAAREALAKRKAASIGLNGVFSIHDLNIHIKILDVKNEHGHWCYLIQPLAGTGATWIRSLTPIVDTNPKSTPTV